MFTILGHVEYQAPEMVGNNGYDGAIEIWAIGVMLFQLLVGRSPYPVKLNQNNLAYKLNYNKEIDWPTDFKISK